MISCKQVAALILSDQLQSQTRMKRMEVRLHLAMCRHCSRLRRQLGQISDALKNTPHPRDAGFETRLLKRLSGE